MADGLNSLKVKLDQTLHGYSEGHRLVAGSLKLGQRDARSMLVLSDASGSGVRIPPEGYLTGYPLADAGKYVLARTWPAPEMARPGCVWTHSLLIGFADLAQLATAADLAGLLVRPSAGAFAGYGRPCEVTDSAGPGTVEGIDLRRVGPWLGGLYTKPRAKIMDVRADAGDDRLVLEVWMQQWPRLRRAFRFCTLSGDDRSTATEPFDLQLVAGSRDGRRPRMPDTAVPAEPVMDEDVGLLLDDLRLGGRDGLRRFLRDVGGDMGGGRAAMVPLVKLFVAMEPGSDQGRLAAAIDGLGDPQPGEGRLGRAAAARSVLSRLNVTERRLVAFAVEEMKADGGLLGLDPDTAGRALLKWDPDAFCAALYSGGPLGTATETVLATAEAGELVAALSGSGGSLPAIISARPDILADRALWQVPDIDPERILFGRHVPAEQEDAIVAAIVCSGLRRGIEAVAKRFGIPSVARALESVGDDLPDDLLCAWLRQMAARPTELAACLTGGFLQSRRLLLMLARLSDPDAVPDKWGDDPWVVAVRRGQPSPDVPGEDLLAAFLFSRAMSWRTKFPGLLLSLSLQRLYDAAAADRLPYETWKVAEHRLLWSPSWNKWDRCERLLQAVASRFVDGKLPPEEFAIATEPAPVFERLVRIAASTYRGRQYLDQVRQVLRKGPDERWRERARLIGREID